MGTSHKGYVKLAMSSQDFTKKIVQCVVEKSAFHNFVNRYRYFPHCVET
nr:MAG TPA: hypothetical protein [Caudoviricetes sp.]